MQYPIVAVVVAVRLGAVDLALKKASGPLGRSRDWIDAAAVVAVVVAVAVDDMVADAGVHISVDGSVGVAAAAAAARVVAPDGISVDVLVVGPAVESDLAAVAVSAVVVDAADWMPMARSEYRPQLALPTGWVPLAEFHWPVQVL